MKRNALLIGLAIIFIAAGCAAVPPQELIDARQAYHQAYNGPAAQVAQVQLHAANVALTRAEQSFNENPESYQTVDLAYIARRKSEIAQAAASIAIEQASQTKSNKAYTATQGEIIASRDQSLSRSQSALTASERSGEATAAQLSREQTARTEAEQRATEARSAQATAEQRTADALASLAAVRQEARGMVITLSGSLLFASGQSALLPDARSRLDKVGAVLLATPGRKLIIEGHTDSQGSDGSNQALSQRRADAVRDALVKKGYQTGRIQSNGLGEGHPIANNTSAEGRANNRRVEIIVVNDESASR